MFRSQGHQGTLPEEMPPEMLTYRFYAHHYHWTPDQVRELELDEVEWLPLVETAALEAERQEQAAAERMARRKQG